MREDAPAHCSLPRCKRGLIVSTSPLPATKSLSSLTDWMAEIRDCISTATVTEMTLQA